MASNRCVECGRYVSAGDVRCGRCAWEVADALLTEAAEERVRTDPAAHPTFIHPSLIPSEFTEEQKRGKIYVIHSAAVSPPSFWARLRRAWRWLLSGRDGH